MTGSGLAENLYLDLLKRTLAGMTYEDPSAFPVRDYDEVQRRQGRDRPRTALTMIGLDRLDSLQDCVQTVLDDGVPGDLLEAGCWRCGACILMRGVLAVRGVTNRDVWVADSFAGFPQDCERSDDRHMASGPDQEGLAVSRERAEANFARFGLLDTQVRFAAGWFADTLPDLPVPSLAVLRVDCDLYSSVTSVLEHLYPRLEPGGVCIIDDFGSISMCQQAVTGYRDRHQITEPMTMIDWTGALWRKDS